MRQKANITCVAVKDGDECAYRGEHDFCQCKNKTYANEGSCTWQKENQRKIRGGRRRGEGGGKQEKEE